MRALKNKTFLTDLKEGVLAPITEMVKSDTTLCLELRGRYINIYYRGGSLMKISTTRLAGTYSVSFNKSYFRYGDAIDLPERNIKSGRNVEAWLGVSPSLKRAMDQHFAKRKRDEREFQQLVLRDNNFGSIAGSTDYYICDIEYRSRFGQFDMIAVEWPSTSQDRKQTDNRRLIFVEVKHGDKALANKAGIHSHIRDINNYVKEVGYLREIKEDMVAVFNQKMRLGLMTCEKELRSFSDQPPRLFLVLVNHDPDSERLLNELKTIPESPHVELCIATASFLGYGLYNQGVHSLEEARKRFGDYIYRPKPPAAN